MKYWVLDKNVLENEPMLDALFSAEANEGVLFENAFIEMQAGNNPDLNMQRSLQLLNKYQGKIKVAHDFSWIESYIMNGHEVSPDRLIDPESSASIHDFINAVQTEKVQSDNAFKELSNQSTQKLLQWNQSAEQVLARAQQEDVVAFLNDLGPRVFGSDAKLVSSWHPIANQAWKWWQQLTTVPSATRLKTEVVLKLPSYRIVLFQLLFFCWLKRIGNTFPSNQSNFSNDLTDMTYCAMASYFDGLLSCEKKVNSIFHVGSSILELLRTNKINVENQA